MNEKSCVVTLGINAPPPAGFPKPQFQNFSAGIANIRRELASQDFPVDLLAWDQSYPAHCPRHEESPMGFKPYCLHEAQKLGYRYVLWLDASIHIHAPLQDVFSTIASKGYLFFAETHSIGQFCKDEALLTLGVSREESFSMPSCWSCAVGLDLGAVSANSFLKQWMKLASDGITFQGPKHLELSANKISSDPRVTGHRHDQTAASVLALRLGMTDWLPKEQFYTWFQNDRFAVRRYDHAADHERTIWDNVRDKFFKYLRGAIRRMERKKVVSSQRS